MFSCVIPLGYFFFFFLFYLVEKFQDFYLIYSNSEESVPTSEEWTHHQS